jgi:hypothetical protein
MENDKIGNWWEIDKSNVYIVDYEKTNFWDRAGKINQILNKTYTKIDQNIDIFIDLLCGELNEFGLKDIVGEYYINVIKQNDIMESIKLNQKISYVNKKMKFYLCRKHGN